MSTKTDFTPEEWETLRNAPYLAAAAVMVAGRSGILGSIKEAFVIAQTFYESASSERGALGNSYAPIFSRRYRANT